MFCIVVLNQIHESAQWGHPNHMDKEWGCGNWVTVFYIGLVHRNSLEMLRTINVFHPKEAKLTGTFVQPKQKFLWVGIKIIMHYVVVGKF